ncbi:acyltransferase [Gilvimarinus sp. SDUM040013]|uniref:Acyltransferase n=1 Tax=Gilvimarinus gilvus TaxID=3058038 RepID=A0ABU4RWI0_9GAMM|nr:acyltransferase [Gilvimarinus sp. SDUM040013]MDO3385257.1 acyltransferase [Gilvimarinus sp. SDUM040013]MDX6849240.1 acyltransferase [Gilvimarinus sp. SDUM040013]
MTPTPPTQQRIKSLDGLRGVAVFIIILFHVHPLFISGGFLGVDVFFVLSGFLITGLLLDEFELNDNIKLKYFYARRALRLMPALLLILAILVPTYWLFADASKAQSFSFEALIAITYTTNLAVAFEWFNLTQLRHTWSLAIEEQFYLIWPLLLLALHRRSRNRNTLLASCLALWAASIAVRVWLTVNNAPIDRLYCGLDTRADALMAGAALAVFLRRNDNREVSTTLWLKWCWLPASVVLGYFMFSTNYLLRGLYLWQLPIVHIASALVIMHLASNRDGILARALAFRPIFYLGKISYGVYLWHVPVLLAAIHYQVPTRWLMLVTLSGTILLASASYYFVERKLLRLKQHFAST